MPLPLIFIGIAAVTGATGLGAGVKAGVDQSSAQKLNTNADERIKHAAGRLDRVRVQCRYALETLGAEKVFVLNGSLRSFVESFSQIKNVDFSDSVGLQELSKFHIDQMSFDDIAELASLPKVLISGSLAGATGGALTALGAYSAATTFATASTGTAISALNGIAASNATMAFFGGGSIASGGMGIAGGTVVLGGLIAGPALLVMGIIFSAKAGTNLNHALANAAEADVICAQLENSAAQCVAIRRRTYMFYSLLARLDAYFLPLIYRMQEIMKLEGCDYAKYCSESKKSIAAAASIAVSIKAVLDTPILSSDGSLTDESREISKKLEGAVEVCEDENAQTQP